MKNEYHVQCNKIFGDGTVLVFDYNVNAAIKANQPLVCHYEGKKGSYRMTIPVDEIIKRGKLDPTVHTSKFNGPHKQYKNYYFQWKEDK